MDVKEFANLGSLGVDIVKVSRIREIALRHGERFLSRYFSKGEIDYSMSKHDPYPHLAARFAAKEAAYKAFSSAGMSSLPLSSFEVIVESTGVPRLRVVSPISGVLVSDNISVSLSHEDDYAVAVVALFGDAFPQRK